mgnify:CR=1 FL=1
MIESAGRGPSARPWRLLAGLLAGVLITAALLLGALRFGLALVPEPENEHDAKAVAIWNEERTLQVGYVPREIAPKLRGDEQAVSLWRVEGGLRVLIAPADAWLGIPRS